MSDHARPSIVPAEMEHASLRGYIFGFVGSIVLTVAAYLLVVGHASTNGVLVSALVLLVVRPGNGSTTGDLRKSLLYGCGPDEGRGISVVHAEILPDRGSEGRNADE